MKLYCLEMNAFLISVSIRAILNNQEKRHWISPSSQKYWRYQTRHKVKVKEINFIFIDHSLYRQEIKSRKLSRTTCHISALEYIHAAFMRVWELNKSWYAKERTVCFYMRILTRGALKSLLFLLGNSILILDLNREINSKYTNFKTM